jgi:hypothetical protein
VNDHCFAEDDPKYWALGRIPHPDNLKVSWGQNLAGKLDAEFHCDAESASSNQRIIRVTEDYILKGNRPDLLIIGWSTWEREEWIHGDRYYQVNAGGIGEDWPEPIKERYKKWIVDLDYQYCVRESHREIWNFHQLLEQIGINHYFFTCYEPFTNVDEYDWNKCYLVPYNKDYTFFNWCKNQGFKTTKSNGYHYGPDAHAAWAEFLYAQVVQCCLTKK